MRIDVQCLSVLALGHLALAAVNPTASGQIGINLVDDFGPATQYVNSKWIGVDEGYLTQDTFTQTYTQTVDSKPTPATTAVQIAVATATAAADGYEVGDVSVVFSKELVDKLKGLATTACGGPTKLRKRQSCSFSGAGSFVEAAAGPGGPMNDLLLNGFPKITITAGDIARAIQAMITAGKIAASAAPVAYLASLWLAVYVEQGAKQIVRLPKADVDGSGTDPQPEPSPTSSSSPCPTGANAPLCADQDNCEGLMHVCTKGKYQTCICIDQFDIDGHDIDSGQLKAQQALLASVAALPAPAVTGQAWCVWDADPYATPSAWCECDNAKSTFSIATATNDAACPYTTPPGDTITVVTNNGQPSSTAAPSPPQPTFSSTPPACNTGDRFPGGDVGKMRDGVDAFCKGITDDKIDKAFNPTPICSVQLSDDVWMELLVSASFLDLNGKCTQDNMAHLSTSEEKCDFGMTNAILCSNGQTTHAGNPNSSGGYDTVECVLYQVNTVTSTTAPAC